MTVCFQTKTTGAVTTRHIPRAFFPGLAFLPQPYVYRTSEPESLFYVNYDSVCERYINIIMEM